jgi:phosphoglycerate dehydrogenase-like enzyme
MSLIWINAGLPEAERALLQAELAGREVVWAPPTPTVLEAGRSDQRLAAAAVVFGQPDPEALLRARQLRLVQLTSAGYARYDRDDLRAVLRGQGAALCNASSVYAEPVAEHAVAAMLGLLRRLPEALAEQAGARRWPHHALRAGSRRLAGETVLLLGYGAIARALITRLLPFRPRLIAHRRRRRGDEEVDIVEADGLRAALGAADHVVDLLPEGTLTRHFVDAGLLSAMKPGARFYNFGRGETVDQDALRAALLAGRLDAAWLDVTTPEPLPPEHPLWTTPRLYLSPHTGGGHIDEWARHTALFLDNLARLASGGSLRDRVA